MGIFDFLFKKKPLEFEKFQDSLGNFEMAHPRGWKFDHDIAVIDGQYTNSFQSNDSSFTVAVNAKPPESFDFKKYAKAELESPSSGIYTKAAKSNFRGMPAYTRDYEFTSNGRNCFGGGIMFFTGRIVFSISWSAPKSKKEEMTRVFDRMMESFVVD